jgi:hypothetical protein
MARKKTQRSKERGKTRGPRGPRGRRGPAGPAGENGNIALQLGHVLARVTQEIEDMQRALRVQFTRTAQLQAELDDLRVALGSQTETPI